MAHSKTDETLWIKYDGTAIVGDSYDIKPGQKEEVAYGSYYYKRPSTTQYCNLYTKKPYNHIYSDGISGDYHLTEEELALYRNLTYSSYWVTNFYNEVYTTIIAPTGSTVTVLDDLGVKIPISSVIDNGDGTSNYIIESRTDTRVSPSGSSSGGSSGGVPSPGSDGGGSTTKK